MGFRNGAFAKIWEVKQGAGRFTDVRLSISRKNKESGEYEQDFAGYVRFVGNAHARAAMLKGNERVKLGDVDVTRRYIKERDKEYTNFTVFDFEFMDDVPKDAAPSMVDGNPVEGNVSDEDSCPF